MLPGRAEGAPRWCWAQEPLCASASHSPTRAFAPEEVPGRCCYTWCVSPTGCWPRGSRTRAEERYGELTPLRAAAAVSWEAPVIKACSHDWGEKYTLGQRDQRRSNVHHLLLPDQLAWQTTDVFAEHIVFIYWFMAALSDSLSHGRVLWSGTCWVSPANQGKTITFRKGKSSLHHRCCLPDIAGAWAELPTTYSWNFVIPRLSKNLICGRFAPNLAQILQCEST